MVKEEEEESLKVKAKTLKPTSERQSAVHRRVHHRDLRAHAKRDRAYRPNTGGKALTT